MSVDVDLLAALERRAKPVDDMLVAVLEDGTPPYLYEASRHLIRAGGKRIRPAVLLLVAEALNPDGDDRDRLPAAVAVELVHTLSLIHDDIVDDDGLRRGVPSVHVAWDRPTGIVAGDLLHALAFEMVAKSAAPAEARLACSRTLARACRRLSEGQARDMARHGDNGLTEEAYLRTVEDKTGALFAAAAEMGAILGGSDAETVAAAASFGRSLGTAFQLQDDILDVTSSTGVLGKPIGSDLETATVTLVTIHASQHGVDVSPSRLEDGGLQEFRADLDDAGSLDYVRRVAQDYVDRAVADLGVLPPSSARETLVELASFVLNRER